MTTQSSSIEKNQLIGRWVIQSWVQAYDDGRIVYPMGKDVTGFILYGERHMACSISRPGREKFAKGGQWDGSEQDKAAAYDSFMSYSGTYEIQGEEVVHHVASSLFPNWEGGVQRRRAKLLGDELHLVARLEAGGSEARTATLLWKRADT